MRGAKVQSSSFKARLEERMVTETLGGFPAS